jgi:hypothetical protein
MAMLGYPPLACADRRRNILIDCRMRVTGMNGDMPPTLLLDACVADT